MRKDCSAVANDIITDFSGLSEKLGVDGASLAFRSFRQTLKTFSSCVGSRSERRNDNIHIRQALPLCYLGAPDLLVRRSGPALLAAVVMIMAVLKRSRFASSALSFRRSEPALLVAVVMIMDAALVLRSGS